MFEIIIKEIKTVKYLDKTTWGVVGSKEVEREQSFYASNKDEPKTRIEDVRGYLPPIEREKEVVTETLKQSVESLDLAAVIKAINKL